MIDVCLLGSGGMMPLPYRFLTSLMVRYNGRSILIDCGEGTQVALRRKGWSPKPIDLILFTHYHADHISGLPGLLLTMGNAERTEPLLVAGPKGLEKVVNSLRVIAPELPFEIQFREIREPEESFKLPGDKDFAILLFRYLMNREALRAVVAERSLLWDDDFDQIAQYNFMMLKTLNEDNFDEAMIWPVMYDKREEKDEADMNFARQLLRDTVATREEAEDLIKSHLQGWEFERVSKMDILLINMAVAEFTACPSIPEKVTVDEYIELSKEFSSERSRLFINGILDKIVVELRSKGRINKSGRGLLEN